MSADIEIIEMFFRRSEDALTEIQERYGLLCRKIAFGILRSNEDTEECINSSYLRLWNSIPPTRPDSLCAYLCAVVRNAAFEIYKKNKHRHCEESFEELEWLISDETAISFQDGVELSELLNNFLEAQKPKNRKIFMGRYYFNMSISEIAEKLDMSEAAVKTRLSRVRSGLKEFLSENGVTAERSDA